jgi:predicted MFS family arabinose efflux permease
VTSVPDIAPVNERRLILAVTLIQFVNMMDFIMVMPLGPDFAKALGIPLHDIGVVGGIYAFAASLAGLSVSFFLDKFSRKRAILFFTIGLSLATLGGAIAWDKNSMLGARVLAGLFGGPLSSLGIALISDFIPPQRRGEAIGKIMGGFSLASVLGIPFGLELARIFSWHAPFIATSIIGLLVGIYAWRAIPYHPPFPNTVLWHMRLHALGKLLRTPIVILSYVAVFISIGAAFLIIPNIASHIQINLGYSREKLGWLYFVGGLITFFTMRGAGWLVDKTSATLVVTLSTIVFTIGVACGFIYFPNPVPVMVIFVAFMLSMTTRNIAGQSMFSKIPPAEYRGAYNSLQTSIVHMTQALVAWIGSLILVDTGDRLLNVPTLAWTAIALSATVPFLFYAIEKRLKQPN